MRTDTQGDSTLSTARSSRTLTHTYIHTFHSHSLSFTQTDLNYDPRKSKVSADTTEAWNSSTITGDLIEVPGLGPKALDLLKHDAQGIESEQITNTYMLFGKYLLLKGPNLAADGKTWREVDSIEHNEKL